MLIKMHPSHTHASWMCVHCMLASPFTNDVMLHLPLILRALRPANARLILRVAVMSWRAIIILKAWLTLHDREAALMNYVDLLQQTLTTNIYYTKHF